VKHSAQKFGAWLKARRKRTGTVLRVFAGLVGLAPAEYAEVEAGVVRWIGKEHERLIIETLALSEDEEREFAELLVMARAARPLELSDVFTREQLEPMRARNDKNRLTPEAKAAIVDAVLKPLS
jgi:transcriptional regulator with XRE-family HTH domain